MERRVKTVLMSLLLILTGCSTHLEASRPEPVNLAQFKPGDERFDVVAVAGAPTGKTDTSDGFCDIYKLFTTGSGGFRKGLITTGEVLSNVVTVGLTEVIWTPLQAATQPVQHTVLFCYDNSSKLIAVHDKNPNANNHK
jgi:hypothetical protein